MFVLTGRAQRRRHHRHPTANGKLLRPSYTAEEGGGDRKNKEDKKTSRRGRGTAVERDIKARGARGDWRGALRALRCVRWLVLPPSKLRYCCGRSVQIDLSFQILNNCCMWTMYVCMYVPGKCLFVAPPCSLVICRSVPLYSRSSSSERRVTAAVH